MSACEVSDDMQRSLSSISSRHSKGKVTTQLANIQQAQIDQGKSRDFIEHLECLCFRGPDDILVRRTINAYRQSRYVALSYTWKPSPLETKLDTGGYLVQQRIGSGSLKPSPVRDNVFTRVRKYMKVFGVNCLWIDQHCIEQEGEAKEIGMQAMDLVYSRSNHPVALLARPIKSLIELKLLVKILKGQLVYKHSGGFRLSRKTGLNEALKALKLLKEITSDMWFTRGWTFQENYKAGTKMRLLIPHHLGLDNLKLPGLMKSIEGELCIDSVKFHEEATKLCLACQSRQPPLAASLCEDILSRAGKYTILLQEVEGINGDNLAPQSMSPRVISDLATRELTNTWDRLPIVANCCQYSVRLNSAQLRAEGHSLSLSMLALCLLNGEILSNHPHSYLNVAKARASPIVDFLKMQFFNGLQSPYPEKGLTYNKGCRLVDVRLSEEGIHTLGHLWKRKMLIPTKYFRGTTRRNNRSSTGGLERWERWRLRQLVGRLARCRQYALSNRLRNLIAKIHNPPQSRTFSQGWLVQMASILANAIDQGMVLCTARLINSQRPGYAIFIVEQDFNPNYIFTSIHPRREDEGRSDFNDIDRHVTLEVDLANPQGMGRDAWVPRLFTKGWIAGLCFFSECPLQDVVFPWPVSLQGL
ncbi:heterokaryon incompatibility protein-domain-containing protein [Hypoxylon fuscum]|nr:heterokaryon incompatibility protein-domain-containing protein [Hypoxylon fuscum]